MKIATHLGSHLYCVKCCIINGENLTHSCLAFVETWQWLFIMYSTLCFLLTIFIITIVANVTLVC